MNDYKNVKYTSQIEELIKERNELLTMMVGNMVTEKRLDQVNEILSKWRGTTE